MFKFTAILIFVVGITYISLRLGMNALDAFSGANDTVKAASIASIGSVLVFLFGRFFEQRRELRQNINREKFAIYMKFFDFYFDLMTYEKIHGKPKDQSKVTSEMLEFQKSIVFWGSDAVIKAYLDFKDVMTAGLVCENTNSDDLPKNLAIVMNAVAQLLVAMRRDIGYTFANFSGKDLARLQLSDDEETKKIFEHF